ncbi:MAG: hypothetical protein WDW36_008519 [Sanguina aurantia]
MAGRSALYAIAEKLDHPLVEVRQRASNSLEFKVTHGLVSAADMLAVSSLLCVALNPAEYDCSPSALTHADNGVLLDAALLQLTTRYAAHPSAARQLLHAGAEVVLHHRSVGCESQELLRLVEATRLALTGCPGRAGGVTSTAATDQAQHQLSPAPAPATADPSATTATTLAALIITIPEPTLTISTAQSNPGSAQYPQTTPRYSSPPGSSSPVVQNTPWPGPFQSPQGGDASYSQGAQSSYSPAPAAVMMSPPAAGGAMSHRRLQTPVPRASAWSPSPQQRQQQQQQQQRSASGTAHGKVPLSPTPLPLGTSQAPGQPGSPTPGGHAVLVSKRIDRQRQAANLDREPGSDSGSEAVGSPEDWLLQPAPLGQSDDEALFEVALRLRHSTEPGIALPALQQLTHAWMADLPAEAIVVRHGILDSLLRILSDPGSSSETRQLAAAAVQQLLAGLVCSLATATDMRYQSASGGAAPTQRPTYPTRLPQCAATRAARGDADPGSRQSHAPAGLPPTDGEPLAPVNVSRIVFVVALTAFGLLSDPQRHPLLLPLVEQLLPLLLLGSSGAPYDSTGTPTRTKWAQLLWPLGHALATNLAIARSEAASIVRAYEGSGLGAEGEGAGDGGTGALALVINRPCASILMLLGRILPTLPVDLWVSDVIPPAVTDSLATVCKDEVSCLLLPGLREAVAPVLTVLRPDLDLVLDLTRQVEAALGVAEELREQVAQLGSSRCATASSWLHKLHASMPALDLHADPALIQAAISGLSQICSAPAGGLDAGVGERACAMMLQLLTHRSGRVCSAVYALLEGMVQGMRDSSAGQPLVQQLLCAEGTLEHLVVSGLGDPRVEASVARILTQLLQWGDAACRACLHRWVFWVGQHAADPLVGALASSLAASHAAALQRLQPGSWDRLVPALRGLFGSGVGGRRAAAGELAVAVVQAGVYLTPEAGSHTDDPLKVVLDGGAHDTLVLPAASNPRLLQSFREKDLTDLVSILSNPDLAVELRRSAAEQLLALSGEPTLLPSLSSPHVLATALRSAAAAAGLSSLHSPSITSSSNPQDRGSQPRSDLDLGPDLDPDSSWRFCGGSLSSSLAQGGLEPPALDVLSSLDVQLPMACMNLLYAVAARSVGAREWLMTQGSHTLTCLLPLVFHSLSTVRRSIARMLAAILFGSQATLPAALHRHSLHTQHGGSSDGGTGSSSGGSATPSTTHPSQLKPKAGAGAAILRLPELFRDGHVFPCAVAWLDVGEVLLRAGPGLGGSGSADGAAPEGRSQLTDLASEQRAWVALLVAQRRLLRVTGGDAGQLIQLLDSPAAPTFPPWALHTCAANLRTLHHPAAAAALLASLAAASSHAQCSAALAGLTTLCASSARGLAAVLSAPWQESLQQLLSQPPANEADRELWRQLLPLLLGMIKGGGLSRAQHLHLATRFQLILPPLLSTPEAALAPTALPLALAGSGAVEGDAHSAAQQSRRAGFTQGLMEALAALIRSARTSLPLAAAAQLAQALDPSSLLHLLTSSYLQLTATASYCCRVTAGVVMAELLQLLQATATASPPSDQRKALDDSLASALSALLAVVTKDSTPKGPGTTAGAPTPNAPHRQHSLVAQPPTTASAASAAAAAAGDSGGGGGGVLHRQALLRVCMDCMVSIMALLPAGRWAATWQKVSGTFWLSRLCRHRDARVRGRALQLLALLMGPGAAQTQHMVAQGWPDCVDRMVDIVMDGSEQYCSRTAALHLLCGALAADPEGPHSSWAQRSDPATKPDNGSSRRQLFTSGSQALLRHPTFWDAAPSMLHDAAAPASFTRALQALMLQGLVLDADSFTPRLQQPGVPQRLLLLLQPESSAAGAHSAARFQHGSCTDPSRPAVEQLCQGSGGGGGGGGGDAGGPRFGVHGGGSRTGGSGAQDLDHSSVAGAASMCVTAFDDMPLRGVADSQSQGPTQTTGTGPAPSLESARPHKPTPGLVTSGNILASAGLAAQILSLMTHHAVDPSGPAADDSSPAGTTQGRLPAGVAAAATLTALWVMAAAVPEVEARGDAAVAAVAAVHVQHGVTLHQVADACAQLLQGLSQLELAATAEPPPSRPSPTPLVLIPIQAASHVQQGRKRGAPTLRLVTLPGHRGLAPDHPRPSDAPSGPPHSRAGSDPTRVTCDAHVILSVESRVRASQPLLVACCAALSSACVQQPAKLAVACLVSTLLAEAPTAKALLHATHSEYEHTLTSTGLTVGATLCQALDSLLPSQALCITSSVANPTTHRHHHHHQHSHQRPPHPSSSPSQKTDSRPVPFSAPPFENLGGPRSSRSPEPQHLSSLSPAHPHHTQRHSHNHSPPPGSHGTAANHSSNSAPGSAQSSAAAAAAVAAAAAAAAGVSQAQLHALQTVVPQGLQGEELVIIVAMRNLLAHSAGAKLHALRAGLHATLLRCCAAGAAQQPAAGRGFAASAAPAASPHAGSGGGGGGGGGGSGRTPLRPNPSVFASSPAEVRTPGSSGRATTAVANTPGSAVSAPRQQQPLAAAEQRQRLQVLDQKLTASLSLLKHLALASPTACSTLLHAHAVPTLRRLWRHAATATSGSVFHELLGLLLNLAADPAAGGCSCRAQLAGEGAPPLLKLITDMLFAPPSATLSPPTRGLLARLLACVASFEDGACLLVKSGDFLSQCCRGLRGLAASKSAPRASDTAHHIALITVLHNLAAHTEGQRCILRTPAAAGLTDVILSTLALPSASPPPLLNACLLLLRNLSFSAEARTHLLAHPGVLCAMVGHAERVAENPEGAAQAVSGLWALVHSGEKTDAAVGAGDVSITGGGGMVRAVGAGAHGRQEGGGVGEWLAAMEGHGEDTVKAALRRLPSCVQRLNAIAATADFTLTQLSRAADVAAANAHRQQQQQQQRQRQTGSDAGKSSARPKPNPSNLLLPRPHSHTAEGSQTPAWQNRVGAASMAEEGPGAAGMDAVDFVTRSHAQGLSAAAAGGIRSRDAEEWLLATAETVGALLEVMGATSLLGEGRDGGEAVQWAAAGGAWKQQRLQQQQQQQQQHDRSPLRDPLGGGRKPIVHGRPRDAWVDQA